MRVYAMFCDKCGAPILDGQKCPNCYPAAVQSQQDAQQQDPFQLNTGFDTQETPKKKEINLIAVILGAVAAVAVVAVCIFLFSGLFRSPRSQLQKLERSAMHEAAEALADGYGEYLENLSPTASQKPLQAVTDLRITADTAFLSNMIAPLTGMDISSLDLSWFQNILLRVEGTTDGSQTNSKIGLGLNDTVVATMDVYIDMAQPGIWMGLPKFSDQYLHSDLSASGMDSQYFSDMLELSATLAKEMPSEDAFEKMLDNYIGIMTDSMVNVEKTTQVMTVGGIEQSMNLLQLTMTSEELAQMVSDLVTEATTDTTLKSMVEAFSDYINGVGTLTAKNSGTEYEPVDLYAEMIEGFDELLTVVNDPDTEYSPEDYLVLTAYVGKDVIAGHKLEIFSEIDEPISMHYLTVTNGKDHAFEALCNVFSITGGGTGDAGDYTVKFDGATLATVKVTDWNASEDACTGKIRLIPGEYLLCEMMGLDSTVASVISMSGMGLEVIFDLDETATFQFNLVSGNGVILGLQTDYTITEGSRIALPQNTVDITSEADMQLWLQGLDLSSLPTDLTHAGLPENLSNTVSMIIAMLQAQMTQTA